MNDPLDWMTRELNKNNAKLKDYTPRYNKSVSFDRIFKYDTNVVTKNPASVNYMKPFSFDLTCTKMNTERPKLVDKYLNNSTNKHLRIADRMRKVVGNVTVNRAVDMSNIPSEEQDKVLKILGMTESQLKDTKPENYFGTRIGRTGAKEQVIYNFDLWMQYPVLNEDAAHLEMNERYKINYAFGSPLVMGSIQARTIWIQKSVYKPINWNDVEKLGIDNQRAVVPISNMPNPLIGSFDPSILPPPAQKEPEQEVNEPQASMNDPIVEEPSSIQITETNIPHADDELTDRDVYNLCNLCIDCYKFSVENNLTHVKEAFTRFFGSYDKNENRMRQRMVNIIVKELQKSNMSPEFENLFNILKEYSSDEDKEFINNTIKKLNSKRGDTGRDAFWKICKSYSVHATPYTANIDTPVQNTRRLSPNGNFELPKERPPKPTQLPNVDF